MPKIIFIPKEQCRYSKKYECYLLPKTVRKSGALGVFKYMYNTKTKKPLPSRRMDIYVACGNGWLTLVTLVHEIMHYINARFFSVNKRFDMWIEKWL
jgi:hypothetical protein